MTPASWQPRELRIESTIGEIVAREWGQDSFAIASEGLVRLTITDILTVLHNGHPEAPGNDRDRISIEQLSNYEVYEESIVRSLVVDLAPNKGAKPPDTVWFDLLCDGTLCAELSIYNPVVRNSDIAHEILSSIARRNRCELVHIRFYADDSDSGPCWSVALRPLDLELDVARFVSIRDMASHLLRLPYPSGSDKLRMPRFDWKSVYKILLNGHPGYLVGQEECAWLEVKSQPYSADPAGEIELAQDIARFANGDGPGLLVLGYREKSRGTRKIIDKMAPLEFRPNAAAIYHKTIDRRVYPPIRGLTVESVAADSGAVMVFVIPQQAEEDKPFLVSGAIINGKCEGAFISIVRRRGEHSIPVTPASIHATLAAGRIALHLAEPRPTRDNNPPD